MKKTVSKVTKTVTKKAGGQTVTTTTTTTTTHTTTAHTATTNKAVQQSKPKPTSSQPQAPSKLESSKLREVSQFVFLEQEIIVREGIESLSYEQLPQGYSLPTPQDYQELLEKLGPNAYKVLSDPNGFAGKDGMFYVTGTKSYPDKKNGSDNAAWQFKALSFKSDGVEIVDVSSFFEKEKLIGKVVPQRNGFEFAAPVSGSITSPITVSVVSSKGVIEATWDFGDGSKSSGLSTTHQYKSSGSFEIIATISFFGNITLKGSKKILILETAAVGEDEIINGVNYGKPVVIGKQIWLNKDVESAVNNEGKVVSLIMNKGPGPKGENDFALSQTAVIPGWRLPNKADVQQLIDSSGESNSEKVSFLTNKEGFNGQVDNYYITSDFIDENSPASLYIGKESTGIEKRWKWANAYCSFFNTRLIANEKYTLIPNFTQSNVHVNEAFQFKFLNTNIVNVSWEFEKGSSSTEKSPTFSYKTPGFKNIKVAVTLFGNRKISEEFEILLIGSSINRKFDLGKIVVKDVAKNAYENKQILISHSTAGICPKNNGGFYICWRDASTSKLQLALMDCNCDIKSSVFTIDDDNSYLIDIASYPKGCIVFASTENERLYIKGVDDNGKTLFSRNIINNGKEPVAVKEQLSFCNPDGTPQFGTNLMYNPANGKALYANQRILTLFSHYNCFKLKPRDNHTGDAMISFDLNGKDEKSAWMWGVSHSVLNTMMFDGMKVMSASLGDAYPVNITLANNSPADTDDRIDGKTKKNNMLVNKRLGSAVEGFIPGNHGGLSAGRIGNIVQIGDLYYLPYSRGPCKYIEGEENKVDELAIVVFKQNLQIVKYLKLGKGANVNVIKSCSYGSNILIMYNEEASNTPVLTWPPKIALDKSKLVMMQVDVDGKVIQKEVMSGVGTTASDDMRLIDDGSVVWTWISNGVLKVCKLA